MQLLAEARQGSAELPWASMNSGMFSAEKELQPVRVVAVSLAVGNRAHWAAVPGRAAPEAGPVNLTLSWRRLRAYDTQGLARSYSNLSDDKTHQGGSTRRHWVGSGLDGIAQEFQT